MSDIHRHYDQLTDDEREALDMGFHELIKVLQRRHFHSVADGQ